MAAKQIKLNWYFTGARVGVQPEQGEEDDTDLNGILMFAD